MAAPGGGGGLPIGPDGNPLTREQLQQIMAMEAQKRGMTPQQFQEWQQQQIAQEAAKHNMSPQQFVAMKQAEQRQQMQAIAEEAKKLGITPQQFVMQKQREAQEQMARQQQQQGAQPGQSPQQGGPPPGQQQQVQQIPLNQGVVAKPEALAMAKFLQSQNLKTRTVILDGQRREMFKGLISPLDNRPEHANMPQSNVHSGSCSPMPTRKLALRTLSFQKSATITRPGMPFSFFPCRCSPSECRRKILMKATIMPNPRRRTESKANGRSRSSHTRNLIL